MSKLPDQTLASSSTLPPSLPRRAGGRQSMGIREAEKEGGRGASRYDVRLGGDHGKVEVA